jgi:predicted SnoaL-like aldol condensation-catalyzing enzyme
VATQNKWLMRGLDPALKSARLANYIVTLRKELLQLSRACGVCHPALVGGDYIEIVDGQFGSRSLYDLFGYDNVWALPSERDAQEIEQIMGNGEIVSWTASAFTAYGEWDKFHSTLEGRMSMKTRFAPIALGVFAVLMVAGLVAAQDPVVGSKDPESLFTSKDPKLHTNKQAAMHIMRDLLEAGHWDEAPKWLTERYIQHNPCCANGRKTVMDFFGGRGAPRPIPNRNSWATKVVSVVAEGDLVTVGVVRECVDPRAPGKTYTTTWFDMWRFVDGKADEHWDFGTIAGAGNAPDCARPAPAAAPAGRGQRQ